MRQSLIVMLLVALLVCCVSTSVAQEVEAGALVKVWIWGLDLIKLPIEVDTDTEVLSVEMGSYFRTDRYKYSVQNNTHISIEANDQLGIEVIAGLQLRIYLRDNPDRFVLKGMGDFIPIPGRQSWFDLTMDLISPPNEAYWQFIRENEINRNPFSFIGNMQYIPIGGEEKIMDALEEGPIQTQGMGSPCLTMAIVQPRGKLATTWGKIKTH